MQKFIARFIYAFMILGLVSCSEDFLEQEPSDSVPFGNAAATIGDMEAATNGTYARLRDPDLFGRSIPINGDLRSDNVYISTNNSGRYIFEWNYRIIATSGNVSSTWLDGFNVILRANTVINSELTGPEADQLKGEALTVRALMMHELVKHFGTPYVVNPSGPGIPIILDFAPADDPSRNTTAEVYAQIVSDLQTAADLMTEEKNSTYASEWVAKGLLARVYLDMGDNTNAAALAQDVINNGGYALSAAADLRAFWNEANPTTKGETLFEVSMDAVDNAGFDSLARFYNQEGYGDALSATDLYAMYSDTDARKGLIIEGERSGEAALIVDKFTNVTNPDNRDNLKVLRLAEVYLIMAEASAKLGNTDPALTALNAVAQARDPQFAGYASSGDQLLTDVLNERRKELAFEGHRFWDLVRNQIDIERNEQFPADVRSISINDTRIIFPIPQTELDANPNMTQNEGYN